MIRARALLALLLIAGPLGGCAYYNGLYNANRFARRAERAEREGRTSEAQGYWGQVQVKADTALARHPHSKWTTEARYLSGTARERTGDCPGAVPLLALVINDDQDPRFSDEAALRLSACQVKLGDLSAAGFAVERLITSTDPARRAEAEWRVGVAYRRTGRAEEAVTLLRASGHPRARGELAAALADAGRISEAVALSDSLVAVADSTVPWGAVLSGVGQRDIPAATALLDRVLERDSVPGDSAATWLVADANRILPTDETRALARLEAAYQASPAHAVGVDARIQSLRHRLASTEDVAFLDSIPTLLGDIEFSAGEALTRGRILSTTARSVRVRLDSLDIAAPLGDISGFFLGEALRDSLAAPRLAAQVWRRVLAGRPESPYAPKLLLALRETAGSPRDSITSLIETRYAASPYVLASHGLDDPGFRVLEDSLARYARARRTPARPPARAPARGRVPPTTPTPVAPLQ